MVLAISHEPLTMYLRPGLYETAVHTAWSPRTKHNLWRGRAGGKTLSAGWNFAVRQLAVLFANKNGKVSGTAPSPRFSYSVHSIQPAARFPPRKTVADGRQRYIFTIQSFRPPVPIRNAQAGKKIPLVNCGREPVRMSKPIRRCYIVAAAYNAAHGI